MRFSYISNFAEGCPLLAPRALGVGRKFFRLPLGHPLHGPIVPEAVLASDVDLTATADDDCPSGTCARHVVLAG